ncbi:hypothetical protein ABPG77_004928 [Micractinium sp. CCAP 211/92]
MYAQTQTVRAAVPTRIAAAKAAAQARHAPNAAPGRAARMQRRRAALSVRAAAAAEQSAAPAGAPGGLNVREEQLPGCGMRLHVTVPAEQCRAAYTKFMNDLRKGTTVDGFRKGKAPDAAIIAQVGGLSRVLNSVLGDMLEPAVAQAMRPYEGVAVPESEHIEQNAEQLEAAFSLENGLSFSIRFDAVPPLTWKTPYSQLEVTVESAGDEASDVQAAEEKLLSLRKGQAKLKVVADRGLQRGDLAIIDFSASRADTGEELLGAERRSMRLDTDDADRTFLPGIVDILLGMRAGEERLAPLVFPTDEAFQPKTLRGVEAQVKIKMTELFTYDLPELNDEWANSLLPGGGIEGVRQRLVENAAAERESMMRERIADAFTAAVGRAVKVDIPESLLNELGTQQYSVELNRLLSQGVMDFQAVQQLATPELAAQFVQSRREELLDLQRSLLGFDAIAEAEGLQPTEAEIEAEFKSAAQDFVQQRTEFDAEKLREQVVETLRANKVMDWLTNNCKVTVVPATQP